MQQFQSKSALRRLLPWLLLLPGLIGCHDDSNTVGGPEMEYDLKIELSWDAPINMDSWIIEPTGIGSGHGDPGETAQNIGNNDCGFGPRCNPEACSDLPCNTPERILIEYGDALPETTQPFHYYEIGISNWSSETASMRLTVRTPTAARTWYCTVGGPRVSYVATVSFPSGRIEESTAFVENFCQ